MAVAVSISPRNSAESHPTRLRTSVQLLTCVYGASNDSLPPMRCISSVLRASATSRTSSMVMIPSIFPVSSVTGRATRSFFATIGGLDARQRRVRNLKQRCGGLGQYQRAQAEVFHELAGFIHDVDHVQ